MRLPAILLKQSRRNARDCEATLLGQAAVGFVAYALAATIVAPIYAVTFGVIIGILSRCGFVKVHP